MKEEWRDITGYEGLYQVSNLGRVKRMGHWKVYVNGQKHYYKERVRKISVGPLGYCNIRLGSKGRECGVHRLVAETFLARSAGKNDVNHIDGDKENNRVDNLEWVTRKENMSHCHTVLKKETGRQKVPVMCVETGERYNTLTEASSERQINIGHLSEIVNKKSGRKTAGGFHWEKLDTI